MKIDHEFTQKLMITLLESEQLWVELIQLPVPLRSQPEKLLHHLLYLTDLQHVIGGRSPGGKDQVRLTANGQDWAERLRLEMMRSGATHARHPGEALKSRRDRESLYQDIEEIRIKID